MRVGMRVRCSGAVFGCGLGCGCGCGRKWASRGRTEALGEEEGGEEARGLDGEDLGRLRLGQALGQLVAARLVRVRGRVRVRVMVRGRGRGRGRGRAQVWARAGVRGYKVSGYDLG